MSEFEDKIVLVTGGTQGLGLAMAACFDAEGANVHITGTREGADKYEDDLSAFTYHQAILNSSEGCKKLFAELPEVNVLINNAGMGLQTEYEMESFREVFEVNLFSATELSYLYADSLIKSKGAVINVGSLASHLALQAQPAYTASKSAIYGLTRALADRWAPHGVRVNMVAPGFIATRMTDGLKENPDRLKKFERAIPMLRMGVPKEIGNAAVFLASQKASYITGISLPIDGGLMLR